MSWDPAQYAKFTDHRIRPALDLLARVPLDAPSSVVDLGCGPGNVTVRLAERWPKSNITGVDGSSDMLRVAREKYPQLRWQQRDLATWSADQPVEVLYSNATLHWLGDHAALIPHLFAQVAGNGFMAIQMPRNFGAPSHRIAHELANSPRWRDRLQYLVRSTPVAEPGFYYDLLAPLTRHLEIWETEYIQALTGERPVLEWIKGTWLRPFLDVLDQSDQSSFESEYAMRVAEAYPRRADGVTIFPFRRLFLVAMR